VNTSLGLCLGKFCILPNMLDSRGCQRHAQMRINKNWTLKRIRNQKLVKLLIYPFEAAWTLLHTALYISLFVAIIVLGPARPWLTQPVETGAGPMPRWEVGRVYLRMYMQLPKSCQQFYPQSAVMRLSSSANETLEAVKEGDISWLNAPVTWCRMFNLRIREMYKEAQSNCPLPLHSNWTPEPANISVSPSNAPLE